MGSTFIARRAGGAYTSHPDCQEDGLQPCNLATTKQRGYHQLCLWVWLAGAQTSTKHHTAAGIVDLLM